MPIRVARVSSLASFLLLIPLALLAPACATYHDELARGQRSFEQNDPDRTLAILRDLEPDLRRLSPPEQAEYAYLRGMTDYQVGYRSDARHWLALATAMEATSPGTLTAEWKDRATEALKSLNNVVYTQGTSGLTTSRVEGETKGAKDAKDVKDVDKDTQAPSGEGTRPAHRAHPDEQTKDADKPAPSAQPPAATP
jgi:hypothetical protein